ncbi:MAG: hypothetical protein E7Z65_06430 [Thermoplasmata archaeon]|nr:hypothetical protein [Thermoplasmata archaeon]
MPGETFTVRVVADTKDFDSSMRGVKDKLSKAGESAEGMKNRFKGITDSLGKIAPNLTKFGTSVKAAFTGISASMKGAASGITTMSAAGTSGLTSMTAAAATLESVLAPILLIVIAITAGLTMLKKVWEFAKQSFKAYDPTGYAKAFGTFERMVRKLKTAFGALAKGAVMEIMKILIGAVSYLTKMVEAVNQLKNWIDGIKQNLQPIFDVLDQIFRVATPLYGLLRMFSDEGAKQLEEASYMITEATSAGLASFDKLNNLGTDEGDAEGRAKLNGELEQTTSELKLQAGYTEAIWDGIRGAADAINTWWSGFSFDFGRWCDDVSNFFSNGWKTFTNAANTAWNAISSTAIAIWNGITSFAQGAWLRISSIGMSVWNTMSSLATSVWNGFSNAASTAIDAMRSMFTKVIDSIRSAIQGLFDVARGVADQVKSVISSAVSSASSAISGAVNSSINSAKQTIESVQNAVDSVSKGDLGGAAQELLETAAKTVVNSSKNSLPGMIASGAQKAGEAIYNGVKSIFGFASGGLFLPNQPQLAILGDNKAEPKVAAPRSMIIDAVKEALRSTSVPVNNTAMPTRIEIPVEIDGRTVARATYDYLENERIRRNGSGAI